MSPAAAGLARLVRRPPAIAADSALGAAATCLALLGVTPVDLLEARPPSPVTYLIAAASGLPLALRRRFPVAVLAVTATAAAVYYALGHKNPAVIFGPLISIYTVAVHRPLPTTTALAAGSALLVSLGVLYGMPSVSWTILFGFMQCAIAAGIGNAVRVRVENTAQIQERAEKQDQERQRETERALTEQRVRIAHELHDVVAHHISVISVHATLGRYVLDSDPNTTRKALDTISTITSDSLDELGRLLQVLRPSDAQELTPESRFSPQPTLASLRGLASRISSVGVPVTLRVVGQPPPLSPGVELCAYRVAQEALTNVIKHAGQTSALVIVLYQRDCLLLRVADSGQAGRAAANPAGRGLIGMRERAGMYGGTVHSGPRPRRGFQVTLRLPYHDTGHQAAPPERGRPA